MGASIFYLLGAKPRAEDVARYPLILLPVILAVGLYLLLIQQMVVRGAFNFDLNILRAPFYYHSTPVKTFIAGDWPKWTAVIKQQAGMLNHVLGTFLLIALTIGISFPVSAGAGIFLSEYGDGRLAGVARFAINSLRAISVLILGLTAYSLSEYSTGTFLAPILHGTFFNGWEEQVVFHGGSYLTASLAMSLLVIPVITRATEEGCRSLPPELREGSLALGASEETTLRRVVVPWALPNIVTAILLGSVETAGSVAVLLFIAGRGDYGVGPFRQVTSLAFLVFDAQFGDLVFSGMMKYYQFMAALLLLALTLTLGLVALGTKRWLVKRFRGG
jgi:ABC-type phosphate transport system permease subunit